MQGLCDLKIRDLPTAAELHFDDISHGLMVISGHLASWEAALSTNTEFP